MIQAVGVKRKPDCCNDKLLGEKIILKKLDKSENSTDLSCFINRIIICYQHCQNLQNKMIHRYSQSIMTRNVWCFITIATGGTTGRACVTLLCASLSATMPNQKERLNLFKNELQSHTFCSLKML